MPDSANVVALSAFLEAFRDAGYRGLAGALAELVDNSLEAGSSRVDIAFEVVAGNVDRVSILDNGCGIAPAHLPVALQFGGSTRFDSRVGFGRYGMGLPGSSISQARRVDVFSWTRSECPWWSYLALDDIRSGRRRSLPRATRASPPAAIPAWAVAHGTLVTWTACDRIDSLRPANRVALSAALGRTFREALWAGTEIRLDGDPLVAVDPLFLRSGVAPAAARPYGPSLSFEIDMARLRRRRASVSVQFSELPIEDWCSLSNAEKRQMGISKGAGISILRAGREIDAGWFFMGEKRKESYDDWWRCEVSFPPELDELFGVVHTKQGIRPSSLLIDVLTPHLERIAHVLNGRVRRRFQRLGAAGVRPNRASKRAESRDHLLEPPRGTKATSTSLRKSRGLRYEIRHADLSDLQFFHQEQDRDILRVTLNSAHPFHAAVFGGARVGNGIEVIELLILAAARAERRLASPRDRAAALRHRTHWSNTLAAFFA